MCFFVTGLFRSNAMNALSDALGTSAQALELRTARAQVLANNIANADTPGFKARDFDFAAMMRDAAGGTIGAPSLSYRAAAQPSLDGNTVDVNTEQMAYMDNAVRYQATLTMMNAQIRSVITAITGGS